MQLAMWGILGATVGLAAFVDRQALAKRRIALGAPVDVGSIRLQLPKDANRETDFVRPGMLNANFQEPFPVQRRMFVTVSPPASAGLIDQLLEHRQSSARVSDVPFGDDGSSGIVYADAGKLKIRNEFQAFIEVVATAQLKGGPEVTIRSERIGFDQDIATQAEADILLVKEIASTVTKTSETAGKLPEISNGRRVADNSF